MATAALPEVSLEEFARHLRAGRRIPLEGTLETTYRCNLRCAHCYVNEAVGDAAEQARELTTERLFQLIDQIADRGGLFLLLTGGEVLARPDFGLVYLHALGRGLLTIVYTNGTLITDKVADLFADNRPYYVEISLYGMTRETYDRVTQIPGSFDKCLAGIERLRVRGVPFKLKTMALAWNYHEIPAMIEFAKGLGVPFRYDSFLNPRVDCGANRNGELQLSAEQAVQIDLLNPERVAELRAYLERHARPRENPVPNANVYTCGAGETGFTIDPYGNLQLCQLSRKKSADVREGSFTKGWDEDLARFRNRPWQSNSVCRTCNLIALCASCPGAAEMETGDAEKLVPQFCRITHGRAHALMGEGFGHREDASCCLGDPSLPERALPAASSGCGSCSQAAAPEPALIQIGRRAPKLQAPSA